MCSGTSSAPLLGRSSRSARSLPVAISRQSISHTRYRSNRLSSLCAGLIGLLLVTLGQKTTIPLAHRETWASITASAMRATPQGTSVLGRFVPTGRWSAARNVSVAARAVLGVKIPVDRCPVVCARSQSLCNVCYTLLPAHLGPPPRVTPLLARPVCTVCGLSTGNQG